MTSRSIAFGRFTLCSLLPKVRLVTSQMIGTSGSLPDGGPPTGSGAHGDCPFFAMSQAQALASAAEGKEQEPQEHADDAPANVTGSTSNNNNATSANEKPPLSMRSAVTVMSAVRKLKALSHDSADSNGQAGGSRSDGATKSNRREAPAYVRAAAASDARRLSALLGGRGLRELEEIQESSRRLIVVDHDRNAKTKKAVATTIKEGGEAKGDENNNGVLSAYEGPYPKSVPIPANSANADAVTSSNSGIVANGHGAATTWGWDLTARGGPDDRDVGTPDAWIPRHWEMERLSGRHPFNAQPKTSILMEAGFVTPGHLHFTRNHGAVPRLGWDEHRIEVSVLAAFGSSSNKPATTATSSPPEKLVLKMDDLSSDPAARCLPATMTCIGNRRSEFNAIRRTIGFSWGTATAATSVFRGVPLRTVLLRAGVTANPDDWTGCHVEFVGADELPNKVGPGPFEDEPWGKKVNYGTSVPLGKAMDPARDMMLAFEGMCLFMVFVHVQINNFIYIGTVLY